MGRRKKFNVYDYVDHVMCCHYIPNGRFEHVKNEMKYLNIDVNNVDKFTFVYSYDKDFPIYNVIADEYRKIYYKTCNERLPYSDLFDKHAFDVILTHYKAFKIAQAKGWERVLIFEDDVRMLKDIKIIQDIFNDMDLNNDLIILDPSAQHSLIFTKNLMEIKKKIDVYTFINGSSKYFYNATAHHTIDFFSAAFNIYNQKAIKTYVDLWEKLFMFSCDEYFCLSCYPEKIKLGIARYPVCQTDLEMRDNLVSRFFIDNLTNDNFRE